jgi:hypothetical protein
LKSALLTIRAFRESVEENQMRTAQDRAARSGV